MSAVEDGMVALLVIPMLGTVNYQFFGVYRFRLRGASDFPSYRYWLGEKPPQSPFPQVTGTSS